MTYQEQFSVWAEEKAKQAGGLGLCNPFELIHEYYGLKLQEAEKQNTYLTKLLNDAKIDYRK